MKVFEIPRFPNDTVDRRELVRALCTEFICMSTFVFFGTGSVLSTGEFLVQSGVTSPTAVARILPISFAFGISITILVYSSGHISGGHINPAVTLTLCFIGVVSPLRCFLYWIAQILGAIFGSAWLYGATSGLSYANATAPVEGFNRTIRIEVGNPPFLLGANQLNGELYAGNGFLLETMGTFLLCITVLLTALTPDVITEEKKFKQLRPVYAPLAIGLSVFVAHIVLIPFTGCGINPARTLGPAIINSFAGQNVWSSYWIYFVGPFCGSVISVITYKLLWQSYEAVEQDPGAGKKNDDLPLSVLNMKAVPLKKSKQEQQNSAQAQAPTSSNQNDKVENQVVQEETKMTEA